MAKTTGGAKKKQGKALDKKARTLRVGIGGRAFSVSYRILGVILLSAGFLLLTSLYLPKLYATFAPETKVDKTVLERGHFWLVIPKIRVDSPVLPAITVDFLRRGVGHDPKSGFPGQGKNVIIAGHNYDPSQWKPQMTFGLLHELEKGDEVLVANKGEVYHYEVDRKTSLDANDPALHAPTDHEQLTLLTCEPYQNTTRRLKVIALPK